MINQMLIVLVLAGTTLLPIAGGAEEIKIEGGPSSITTIYSPIKAAYEETTKDTLTLTLTNPTKALIALEKGAIDMASIASLAFEDAISKAKKQGVEIKPDSLVKTVVTKGEVVIFLDRSNPVSRLNKEQLKGIFTGQINNWKDVGGADQEIKVLWTKELVYFNNLFVKTILDGQPVSPKTQHIDDLLTLRKTLIATPGAIAISPEGLKMPLLKIPESPTLPFTMLAFTKGKPTPKVQRLLDFYKEEYGFMDELK